MHLATYNLKIHWLLVDVNSLGFNMIIWCRSFKIKNAGNLIILMCAQAHLTHSKFPPENLSLGHGVGG